MQGVLSHNCKVIGSGVKFQRHPQLLKLAIFSKTVDFLYRHMHVKVVGINLTIAFLAVQRSWGQRSKLIGTSILLNSQLFVKLLTFCIGIYIRKSQGQMQGLFFESFKVMGSKVKGHPHLEILIGLIIQKTINFLCKHIHQKVVGTNAGIIFRKFQKHGVKGHRHLEF